jgi:hypothetical protein
MSGMLATAAQVGGIRRLAIVDDAYDPPSGDEISEDAFNRFVQRMEDSADAMASAAETCGLDAADLDDWEQFAARADLVDRLWGVSVGTAIGPAPTQELRESLQILFTDVHVDRISKLQQLKPLEDLLSAMGTELMRLGANPAVDLVAKADVVFLDLFLSSDVPPLPEPGATPRSVLDKARERAMRYLEAVRAETANDIKAVPPAFVLISSLGTAQVAANFRKRTKQTASRFRFISKQAIERQDPQGLLTIAEIFRTCRASAVIEPLRKGWPTVVADATKWVADQLVELDIADFARLYELSLRAEGQMVEDYIKELVAGALAERVVCAFSQHLPTRDRENPFADVPSSFVEAPSNALAELYSATRITRDRGYRGSDDSDSMSGDLYLTGTLPKSPSTTLNGKIVTAVMTPICDLVSRNGKEPAATSVLLLEGTLQPTYHRHELDPQVVSLNGRFYEIDWHVKQPQALPIKALRKEIKDKAKTWLGRLKAEHFLALQSEYLTSFSRVGLLKPPGVYEPLAGKICVREAGELVQIGDVFDARNEFAFRSPDRKKDASKQPIFFTGGFLEHFRELLTTMTAAAEREHATKTKAAGILERTSQLVDFVTRRPPQQHAINDYLKVELLASRGTPPAASQDGVLLIVLWKA